MSFEMIIPKLTLENIFTRSLKNLLSVYCIYKILFLVFSDCFFFLRDRHMINNAFRGFVHLGAGLSVGLSGLAAGYAVGIVGDAGVRGTAQQPRLYVGMILILIFAEVLGLYGLIVAIYLYAKK